MKVVSVLLTVVQLVLAQCGCHTWHNVTAYKGTWHASLGSLNEDMMFVDEDCNKILEFTVSANGNSNTTKRIAHSCLKSYVMCMKFGSRVSHFRVVTSRGLTPQVM